MPSVKQNTTYAEASIRVLKGLEPVKQRPGMYTRTESPPHIVQEVIVDAADDDGRGIPFGLHPEEGVAVLEIVFTRLHAGGKFDKGAGGAYSFSGGLHQLGRSGQAEVPRPLLDVAHRYTTAAGSRDHGCRARYWRGRQRSRAAHHPSSTRTAATPRRIAGALVLSRPE